MQLSECPASEKKSPQLEERKRGRGGERGYGRGESKGVSRAAVAEVVSVIGLELRERPAHPPSHDIAIASKGGSEILRMGRPKHASLHGKDVYDASFICSVRTGIRTIRGLPFSTYAKFLGFWTPFLPSGTHFTQPISTIVRRDQQFL